MSNLSTSAFKAIKSFKGVESDESRPAACFNSFLVA